jgi:hypothetical protein
MTTPPADGAEKISDRQSDSGETPSSSSVVKRLMQLMLLLQLGLASLLIFADATGRSSVFWRDAIQPQVTQPIAPGDQRRPYMPRSVPTAPDDRQPSESPIHLPEGEDSLSFEVSETTSYGRILLLSGRIEHSDAARFERFLDETSPPPDMIALHSPGGRVVDAMQIGSVIRERELDTLMTPGAACVSACPLILFAGVERVVSRSSWVGLHQTYYEEGLFIPTTQAVSEIQSIQAEILRYTQDMGVDPAVHVHALETPPADAYFLVEAELTRYSISTRIVD